MAKRIIEDIKVGESAGGIACGPVGGSIVAEMKLRNAEDNSVSYHQIVETEGMPTLLESDESLYDILIEEDFEDKEAWAKVENAQAGGYCAYSEFYDDVKDLETFDEEDVPLWKLLVFFTRASWEEIDKMKPQFIGKALEEIEVPVCDVEKEYLDEDEELE